MAKGFRIKMIPIVPDRLFDHETIKAFSAVHNAMRDTVVDGVRFISEYPPQKAGSRYRRTGILRRSWTFILKSGGRRIEGSVISNSRVAPYNRAVQGEEQRAFFEGRGWRNIRDLISRMTKDLPKRVQKAVGNAFR